MVISKVNSTNFVVNIKAVSPSGGSFGRSWSVKFTPSGSMAIKDTNRGELSHAGSEYVVSSIEEA